MKYKLLKAVALGVSMPILSFIVAMTISVLVSIVGKDNIIVPTLHLFMGVNFLVCFIIMFLTVSIGMYISFSGTKHDKYLKRLNHDN